MAAKYKFFSKHDIAMVGGSGNVEYNHNEEPDGLQEEYEQHFTQLVANHNGGI